jgi:N6-adenosine-specific RNA methylase IME4
MRIKKLDDASHNHYQVVYADPPWMYNDKSKHRGGAERHYRTMTFEDICRLPVEPLVKDNALLFLWVTWPHIFSAHQLMRCWGFEYKTVAFNWIKMNKTAWSVFWGMGHWTRSNSEICLLGVRGKPKRYDAAVHSVIHEPVGEHSAKPDEARRRIQRLSGPAMNRLELFARDYALGWDSWGNELSAQGW